MPALLTRGLGVTPYGLLTRGLGATPLAPVLDFRQALVAALLAAPSVSAVIGSRLYPLVVPELAPLPAMAYQVLSNTGGQNLGGSTGTAVARVQFTALSRDFDDCMALSLALYDLFDAFQGALPGGVQITDAVLSGDSDLYDSPPDDSDAGTYRVPIDVIFHYRRPTPAR